MKKVVEYLKARFAEKGTWVGIGAAAASAAAFGVPWAPPIVFVAGMIAVLVPSPKKDREEC